MSYIKSSLSEGEKLLHTFSIHRFGWYWAIAFSCILIGIPMLLRLIGTEMGITSKRLIYKTGIIGRKTNEIKGVIKSIIAIISNTKSLLILLFILKLKSVK